MARADASSTTTAGAYASRTTAGAVARALLVAFTAVLPLACAPGASPPPAASAPPMATAAPIIIIDIDTLRADHLGCYGYARDTSPNLDRFAAEAVQFRWAFSQAPNTPPSQTSILSGLYPTTHGMIGDEDRVPDEVVTLAEALRTSGYCTAGFHDGGYMSQKFNIGQGFDLYEGTGGKGLEVIGPKALGWLQEHADEQSFLLFVHTYDTHTPYAPMPPNDTIFMDGVPAPSPGFVPNPEQMEAIRLSKYTDEPRALAANDLAYAIAQYDGEIRFVDTWFGEFMSVLDELDLDDRAIVAVVSDHGEEFQEHGSVLHEKLYATVTRVPLLIRLPGGRGARQVATVVQAMDLMPTLLELTRTPIPPAVQARSLVPLMTSPAPAELGPAFGESPFFGQRRFAADGHHRLLLTRTTDAVELYDFVLDPSEQNEISELYPEVAERLRRSIDDWGRRAEAERIEAAPADEELDPETLEQLRELGYVQ